MLLKISPDLDDEQLDHVADACLRSRIDGVIVSNTTLDREKVIGLQAERDAAKKELEDQDDKFRTQALGELN